ncbi:MAG: amidohydrolase family protein, partial [Planctomycetota bacterium]|nr:amidohydrolase family protein [Planctomycetota bacterium]
MLRQLAATALPVTVLGSLAAAAAPAAVQGTDAAAWPAADPADVSTIDALLESLYDVISGDAGEARDWDRFRSLFHPELGRLTPLRPDPAKGAWEVMSMTPDDYVTRAERWTQRQAFHEREIAREVERFGGIAHVWSTYEGFDTKDAAAPFVRGINTIQLMQDGARWWILSIGWDVEREDQPLPPRYLPPATMILTGGKVVAVDAVNTVAEAIAFDGERILALGNEDEILALKNASTRVIDLDGRLAVPGFIEGHGHFLGVGDSAMQLDLRTAKTWDDIVALVAAAAKGLPPGTL